MDPAMSSSPNEKISLPSIHEMFPEELLGIPAHSRPHRQQGPSLAAHLSRAPHEHRAVDAHIMTDNRGDPSPRSAPSPTRQVAPAPGSPPTRSRSNSDEERKHACPECGKAFNRPSSLAIHVNTHTGAKPFQCPFPGCGRRFNVNSNMRRHFRNHTSPNRPFNTASPYTYPLTTVPRPLFSGMSSSCSSTPPAPPRGAPYGRGSSASASDDDELDEREYAWEQRLEDAAAGVGRMRVRGYSTSSVPHSPAPSPSMPRRTLPPGAHRPRSHTYTGTPGYHVRPTVLHPSSDAYRRHQ